MRYLIIGALLALVFILLYRRLRPYILLFQKIVRATSGILDSNSSTVASPRSSKTANKLVRCVGCGTWIPEERAVGGSASNAYCSHECQEKMGASRKQKLAG